ncbi:MAG: hypothetical protein J0I75_21100 [Hyphomicrobium sp.]|nr:hypothetical protein [Hyphomicrobium sp.]
MLAALHPGDGQLQVRDLGVELGGARFGSRGTLFEGVGASMSREKKCFQPNCIIRQCCRIECHAQHLHCFETNANR